MNSELLGAVSKLIDNAKNVIIIQAENPDGDSLGSSIALEQILSTQNKSVVMYCPVQIPGYLKYMTGWSRVVDQIPNEDFDLSIIVDTSSATLLERMFADINYAKIKKSSVLIIDHHDSENDLPMETLLLNDALSVSSGEIIYELATENGWKMNLEAMESIAYSILADSLGLMSEGTSAKTIRIIASLVDGGVQLSQLDERRKEFNKKSEDVFRYKGELFDRVEFHLDRAVGLVVIPWEDIQKYSDAYNPSMLIIDEIRLVEGVRLAAAFKTYPDGKITCKLRANSGNISANRIAEKFGGGGHPYAAGFKVRDMEYAQLKKEFLKVVEEVISEN